MVDGPVFLPLMLMLRLPRGAKSAAAEIPAGAEIPAAAESACTRGTKAALPGVALLRSALLLGEWHFKSLKMAGRGFPRSRS